MAFVENSEPFLARFPDARLDGLSGVTSAFDGCVSFRACLPQLLGTNADTKAYLREPFTVPPLPQTLFPTTHLPASCVALEQPIPQ